jgi:hypothetical protein
VAGGGRTAGGEARGSGVDNITAELGNGGLGLDLGERGGLGQGTDTLEVSDILDLEVGVGEVGGLAGDVVGAGSGTGGGLAAVGPSTRAAKVEAQGKSLVNEVVVDLAVVVLEPDGRGAPRIGVGLGGVDVGGDLVPLPAVELDELVSPLNGVDTTLGGRERTIVLRGRATLTGGLERGVAEGIVTVVSGDRGSLALTIKSADTKVLGAAGVERGHVDGRLVRSAVDVDTTGGGPRGTEGEESRPSTALGLGKVAESSNEQTVVELSLGLDSHTGTASKALTLLEDSLVVDTQVDLIAVVLGEAKVESILLVLVVGETSSLSLSDEVELVEEVWGVIRVLEIPLLGSSAADTGQSSRANGKEWRGHIYDMFFCIYSNERLKKQEWTRSEWLDVKNVEKSVNEREAQR